MSKLNEIDVFIDEVLACEGWPPRIHAIAIAAREARQALALFADLANWQGCGGCYGWSGNVGENGPDEYARTVLGAS